MFLEAWFPPRAASVMTEVERSFESQLRTSPLEFYKLHNGIKILLGEKDSVMEEKGGGSVIQK